MSRNICATFCAPKFVVVFGLPTECALAARMKLPKVHLSLVVGVENLEEHLRLRELQLQGAAEGLIPVLFV